VSELLLGNVSDHRGSAAAEPHDSLADSKRELSDQFDACTCVLREDWDNSFRSDELGNSSGDSAQRSADVFNCTRSRHGSVKGLSLSAFGRSAMTTNGATLVGTLSSPATVHGRFAWVRGDTLGTGSLGSVFKALDQRTGEIFAVKEVRIDQKDDHDVKFMRALENELTICQDLKHPHIVSYLGHDYIDSRLHIYLEYMAGGSISQILSQFGPLDDSLIAIYTRQLLEGLLYLHTREPPVLHRDIKGANILVSLDCKVKLSDFGCSKRTSDTCDGLMKSMKGSIPWMAPEVINSSGYGRMADIWSFGCVLVEMGTAKHPWGHFDNPIAAMRRIGMSEDTPPLPDCISETCKDFIAGCLRRDKTQRPNATDLLQHDFVKDVETE
jgi:serine/threonine protein kinase